jgi:ADP-ribosylglycohydrolase
MMGPSSKPILEALAKGEDPSLIGVVGASRRINARTGSSNGGAMRVAPAGLVHPGDLEGACQTAATSCFPTHLTQIGMAGACAIAAGVSEALVEGADVFSVARACAQGARRGEQLGAQAGRVVPGPSVAKRIEWAVSLALSAQSLEECIAQLEAYIGNSVMTVETVPTAIGFFVFAGGDVLESVAGGVNVGNDTDTIAAISGALAGALKGIDAVPAGLYATVRRANPVDMEAIARSLTTVAEHNGNRSG